MEAKDVYSFCIRNTAIFIRSDINKKSEIPVTAFDASVGLAIGFCKQVDDVVFDIVECKLD